MTTIRQVPLTRPQLMVAAMFASGATAKQIAATRGVGTETIKTMLQKVKKKFAELGPNGVLPTKVDLLKLLEAGHWYACDYKPWVAAPIREVER